MGPSLESHSPKSLPTKPLLPTPPPSPAVDYVLPITPTLTTLTPKQRGILRRASEHLCKLGHLAERRGVYRLSLTFLSIDIKAWEPNTDKILEVGMAWTSAAHSWVAPPLSRTLRRHLLVAEHIDLHNGRHVPDNRAHYNFGRSEKLPMVDVQRTIVELLNDMLSGTNGAATIAPSAPS